MRSGLPVILLIFALLLTLLGWWLVESFPTFRDVDDLVTDLSDIDSVKRTETIYQLLDYGKDAAIAVPNLIELTGDEVTSVRVAAVDVLPNFAASEGVREAISNAAYDQHPRVRVAALLGLYSLGVDDRLITILREKLSDNDQMVRRIAILRLGDLGPASRAAAPELVTILESDEEDIRIPALIALGKIGPEEGVIEAVTVLLNDPDPQIKLAATNTLTSFGKEAHTAVPELLRLLGESPDQLKAQVLIALGKCGHGPEVVPVLVSYLDTDVQSLANAAYDALSGFGSEPGVLDVMLSKLSADEGQYRVQAAYTLAKFGRDARAALPELVKLLHDDSYELRKAVLYAVSMVGETEEVITHARGMLSDPSVIVRGQAAMSLGDIGPGAREAIPDLLELLDDAPAVSLKAALAINSIDPTMIDQTIPVIENHIESDRIQLKSLALKGLGDVGPAAKDVLPKLKSIIDHAPIKRRWPNFDSIPVGMLGSTDGMPQKRVYVAAAYAILRISPGDEDALFLIAQSLGDDFVEIRRYALDTLKEIEWEFEKIEPALRNRLATEPNDVLREEIRSLLESSRN